MNNKVLIAGATGYLGKYLVQAFYENNYEVSVIIRNKQKIESVSHMIQSIIVEDITNKEALKGLMQGYDAVVSTVGITRQKDHMTYMDVDYQCNVNLLETAILDGVKKFMYIGVLGGEKFRNLKIMDAKEKFVEVLKRSAIEGIVIRPSGFFGDLKEIYNLAKKGTVYVMGKGHYEVNPIHGYDLANFCVKHLQDAPGEYPVGGPEILSQRDLGSIAFEVLNKPERIIGIPIFLVRLVKVIIRSFTKETFYGPIEFFLTVLTENMVGPKEGKITIKDYFSELKRQE
ncbi:MAG: SDR family oxidoreductase [Clostridia bacterium]|nr:SDR family oxidoreductase [Clostridia bacterium]